MRILSNFVGSMKSNKSKFVTLMVYTVRQKMVIQTKIQQKFNISQYKQTCEQNIQQ